MDKAQTVFYCRKCGKRMVYEYRSLAYSEYTGEQMFFRAYSCLDYRKTLFGDNGHSHLFSIPGWQLSMAEWESIEREER